MYELYVYMLCYVRMCGMLYVVFMLCAYVCMYVRMYVSYDMYGMIFMYVKYACAFV